ncbi:hypothetical protein SEVIR_2G196200v4 [Setaria viridis]|uniref:Uncharacterized protein n=1 Tax=Setaria viridis TaxID=4556 RepID=A0A4U6VSM4_SETVI|nr:uncharacterized protein LOC117842284 [Setaria viridis]TKW32880.1 hypothetical protein SEVIR_2G196200v2 [Setaria viridis]
MKKAVAVGGGGGKGGTAPTDLLVCFPARQHLALMPKPICSPSRTTMDKAAAARRRQLQLPGGASAAAGGGKARGSSPMFRGSKARQRAEEDEEEPQSPKVTCAGQIKVGRPKKAKPGSAAAAKHGKDGAGAGTRSWITVVEEIERLHGRRKKVGWLETLGIRRDALPFLGGALRSLRHKVRCFGSLHGAAVDSTTDSDGDSGDAEEHGGEHRGAPSVFSKWLMVLEGGQEPLEQDCAGDDEGGDQEDDDEGQTDESANAPSAPPPNALLLMRCRSAPAKGLSMSRGETGGLLAGDVEQEKPKADAAPGDGETEDREELVFMSSAPGFLKLSLDIAKETWVVGGVDPLAKSRSSRR